MSLHVVRTFNGLILTKGIKSVLMMFRLFRGGVFYAFQCSGLEFEFRSLHVRIVVDESSGLSRFPSLRISFRCVAFPIITIIHTCSGTDTLVYHRYYYYYHYYYYYYYY